MSPRRSPGAAVLRAAIQQCVLEAQPTTPTVFTVSGVERVTFSTREVAQMLFGVPASADEAKLNRDLVAGYVRRHLIRGERVGNRILIPGEALAEFVSSLGNAARSKAS